MPKAISFEQRLREARELLEEARQVHLPAGGHERGSALVHKRSLLLRAYRRLGRLRAINPPKTATRDQVAAARRLAAEIDAEPAPLLEDVRRGRA